MHRTSNPLRRWRRDPLASDDEHRLPSFDRWARLAIALSMALAMAVGTYEALTAGPYHVRDEQAHVGYAMALSNLRIPTIDTPIEVPPTSPALEERLAETGDRRGELTPYQKVWVANHPPAAYLPALPGVWLGRAIGSGNTVLFSLRIANVAGFAVACLTTALLTREVTRRTAPAVLAAAGTASVPYFQYITSWAMTDGFTLAITVGVVWATIRALRRGFDRNSTLVVTAFAVTCGLTRLTAVSTAALVIGTALVVHAWRRRSIPWKPAVAVGASVAVLTGWFWLGNLLRYGDVAASDELYDRFNRDTTGTLWSTLTNRRLWLQLWSTLLEHNRDWAPEFRWRWTPVTVAILVLAAVGLIALLDRARPVTWDRLEHLPGVKPLRQLTSTARPTGESRTADDDRVVEPGALLVLLAAAAASAVLVANHVKSGGNPFGRYVMLMVPIVACLVGAVLTMVRRPVVAAAASTLLIAIYVRHAHRIWARYPTTLDYQFTVAENSAIRRPVGPESLQPILLDFAGVVGVLLIAAVAVGTFTSCRADAVGDATGDAAGTSAEPDRSDSLAHHD